MDSLFDSIRAGVTDGATPEQRAAAAIAARTFLAALEGHGGGPAMPPPVSPGMPPIGAPVVSAVPAAAPTASTGSLHANVQTIAMALRAGVPIEKVIDAAVLRLEAAVKERDERWLAMMRPA